MRQLSPTPLERHRSRSREPSECRLPGAKLSDICGGRSKTPDISRPGSSLSLSQADPFRLAMEAKQALAEQSDDQVSPVIGKSN